MVDWNGADRDRTVLHAAGVGGKPGHRLQEHILAGALGIGPVGAVAGRRRVDDTRIDLAHFHFGQAELVECPGPEIFHHHVRAFDQTLRNRDPLWRLQVDCDGPLVPARGDVVDGSIVDITVRDGPIALKCTGERFNGYDIRADVPQMLGGRRAGQEMIETQHTNAVESAHKQSPNDWRQRLGQSPAVWNIAVYDIATPENSISE